MPHENKKNKEMTHPTRPLAERVLRAANVLMLGSVIVYLVATHVSVPLASGRLLRSPGAYNARGLEYVGAGFPEEAIREFTKAIKLSPEVAEYHLNLGAAYCGFPDETMALFDWDEERLFNEILLEYRKAVALDDDDIQIAEAYAFFLMLTEDYGVAPRLDESFRAWEHCLEIREQHFIHRPTRQVSVKRMPPLLTMGRIKTWSGDASAAQQYFARALEICPDSRVARELAQEAASN